jgi:hypothetical protein
LPVFAAIKYRSVSILRAECEAKENEPTSAQENRPTRRAVGWKIDWELMNNILVV